MELDTFRNNYDAKHNTHTHTTNNFFDRIFFSREYLPEEIKSKKKKKKKKKEKKKKIKAKKIKAKTIKFKMSNPRTKKTHHLLKLLLRPQLVGTATLLLSAVGGTRRKTSIALAANLLITVVLPSQHSKRRLDGTTTKTKNQMEGGLLLDVVVGEGAAVLELLTSEDLFFKREREREREGGGGGKGELV